MDFPLMKFPDEIVSMVLHNLDYKICQVLMTCSSRLHKLVTRDNLHRRDDVYGLELMTRSAPTKHLLTIFMVPDENVMNDKERDRYQFNNEESLTTQVNERLKYNLMKVRFIKSLSFVRVTIDVQFLDVIFGSQLKLSELEKMDFVDCTFDMTEDQFKRMLSLPNLKKLGLTSCRFNFQINDLTFARWNPAQKLEINNIPDEGVNLTDEILHHWSTHPSFSLDIENCYTRFSLTGVLNFIKTRKNIKKSRKGLGSIKSDVLNLSDIQQNIMETAECMNNSYYQIKVKPKNEQELEVKCQIGNFIFNVDISK